LKAVPAVAEAGATKTKCVAAPPATAIVAESPVTAVATASVTVMVWLPDVFRVAWKVPVPFVRVVFAGSTAAVSALLKWTVPE